MLISGAVVLAAALSSPAAGPQAGEALRDAARRGDVAAVRSQLEAGTPVDAEGRHGLTALMLAADGGHLAVARLLVSRGAAVNARERFFHTSALQRAAQSGHAALVVFLLEKGADDAAAALAFAVRSGNVEIARAALASGKLDPLDLLTARRQAKKDGSAEIRKVLAEASVFGRPRPEFRVAPERLARYAGRYAAGDGTQWTVSLKGEGLVLESPGQPPLPLQPVRPDVFESASGDLAASFGGRADLIEGVRLNRAGELTYLSAVTADPAPLPAASAKPPAPAAAAERGPGRPWPSFRGAGASGIGDGQGAPFTWSVATGANVRFKTPVPGMALSSPIVWGEHVFVTTAVSGAGDATFRTGIYGDGTSVDDTSEHSYRLLALDAKTGAVRWEREVHRGVPPVKRHLKSSQANATPVTDGHRVVVLFGTVGVLAAFDFSGRELWRRDVGVLECSDPQAGAAQWGHASSPILYEGRVIVQADRVRDSFIAAYDLATGAPVWKTARDEPSTWATPTLVRGPDGAELVTNGQKIRGYDPATGRLLWTLGPNSEVVVATPIASEGMAFVTAGYPPVRPVYAIRAGHRGDLSLPDGRQASPAVAWSHERGGTYIPTPIAYRGHLYTVNNNGIVTCYRTDTGERVYQTRLPGSSFAASPVAADGRLYFASETGEVYVLRAGPEFELLATNTMDEVVMATPAISDGLMVVRTLDHVVGLASPDSP